MTISNIITPAFLATGVYNLDSSRFRAAPLDTRTEGWIAGLQLAALSMQDKEDVAEFIAEFAGDDRYIVDYLIDPDQDW